MDKEEIVERVVAVLTCYQCDLPNLDDATIMCMARDIADTVETLEAQVAKQTAERNRIGQQ